MPGFNPIPVGEFLANTPKTISWIWDPFIPAGSLTMCCAYMKTGKSTLVYGLIAAVADGKKFCNYNTLATPTLVLAVEEHPRDVAIRLERFGVSKDSRLFIHAAPLVPDKSFYEVLHKFIEVNHIGFLVVDTLSKFWTVIDENDNSEVQRAVNPLLAIARERNVAVLLVHHANKGEGTGGRLIRGASSLFGIVDQALLLHRYGGGESNKRRLEALGRYEATPRDIIIALDDDTWIALGSSLDATLEALKATLKSALDFTGQTLSVVELGKKVGAHSKKVMKALTPVPGWATRTGSGKKGDPFIYGLASWTPPQAPPADGSSSSGQAPPSGLSGYDPPD